MKGATMKKPIYALTSFLLAMIISIPLAGAHCQIPCGIYDDQLRAQLIAEHATTIEKSMKQIMELSKATPGPANYNQLVRWISNKEEHATQVQDIVTAYFMTQRIKPGQDKYTEKVVVLHKLLLAAMKCKQTTDTAHVNTLRSLLKEFEKLYFGHGHE
jgi:nickel superoxide dismutase